MTYANSADRGALIKGLRTLADYLESNPDVPAPPYVDVLVFPPEGTDAGRRAEIDVIAARLGGKAPETICGHYVVFRFFGPVQYRAVAIPHDNDVDGDERDVLSDPDPDRRRASCHHWKRNSRSTHYRYPPRRPRPPNKRA